MPETEIEVAIDPTKAAIVELLRENTGRALMDSGGYYGRHWQRNAARDFDAEKPVSLSFRHGDVEVSFCLYHYLLEHLEFDAALDEKFREFASHKDRARTPWMQICEDFARDQNWTGLYGDGDPMTIYTYNEDNFLDQDIQFICGRDTEGDDVILLQVHGGCDARGGMSSAKAFRFKNELDSFLIGYRQAGIQADVPRNPTPELIEGAVNDSPPRWHSDSGAWKWHPEDRECDNLEDYEQTDDESQRGQGVVFVDAQGGGYCPITGAPLQAWFY